MKRSKRILAIGILVGILVGIGVGFLIIRIPPPIPEKPKSRRIALLIAPCWYTHDSEGWRHRAKMDWVRCVLLNWGWTDEEIEFLSAPNNPTEQNGDYFSWLNESDTKFFGLTKEDLEDQNYWKNWSGGTEDYLDGDAYKGG
jgi:hypothetical protein